MHMKKVLLVVALLLLGGGMVLFFTLTKANVANRSLAFDTTAEKRPPGLDKSQNISIQKQSDGSTPRKITWLTDYDEALQQAKKEGKLVVIDFFATWCVPCKMMERTTFVDKRVQRQMMKFVPVKIDVDRQRKFAVRYGIQGMPTTMIVGSDGKPITSVIGYLDADHFLEFLSRVKSNSYPYHRRFTYCLLA